MSPPRSCGIHVPIDQVRFSSTLGGEELLTFAGLAAIPDEGMMPPPGVESVSGRALKDAFRPCPRAAGLLGLAGPGPIDLGFEKALSPIEGVMVDCVARLGAGDADVVGALAGEGKSVSSACVARAGSEKGFTGSKGAGEADGALCTTG